MFLVLWRILLYSLPPEKRQKFDNGEDPLDPEQQQGHGGPNPFQGGFPFGEGFQFKFHF